MADGYLRRRPASPAGWSTPWPAPARSPPRARPSGRCGGCSGRCRSSSGTAWGCGGAGARDRAGRPGPSPTRGGGAGRGRLPRWPRRPQRPARSWPPASTSSWRPASARPPVRRPAWPGPGPGRPGWPTCSAGRPPATVTVAARRPGTAASSSVASRCRRGGGRCSTSSTLTVPRRRPRGRGRPVGFGQVAASRAGRPAGSTLTKARCCWTACLYATVPGRVARRRHLRVRAPRAARRHGGRRHRLRRPAAPVKRSWLPPRAARADDFIRHLPAG